MRRSALVSVIFCAAFANAAGAAGSPRQSGTASQAAPGSLIVNGSFEDAPLVRTFLNIAAGASSLKGWQISLGAEVLFDTGGIAGHTDSVGRPEANQVLSENRAAAVKDWLTSQGGVPADRISTRGYGQTMPAATNDTAEGRQRNRRVEIRIQKD